MQGLKDEERILPLNKLMDIVNTVRKKQKIDQLGQTALMEIATRFISQTMHSSCQLAKHRKGTQVEQQDIALHFDREYGFKFGYSSAKMPNAVGTAEHKSRVHLVNNCQ